MAKQRYVNTHFWDDGYIRTLDRDGKLLFIYLLTNPLTNIAGCYEVTFERIVFDTRIPTKKLEQLFAVFARDKKIFHQEGWVLILNFIKNQSLNPKIEKGIEETLKYCPDWIKYRLSIAYQRLSHLNPNLNTNLNPNPNSNVNGEPPSLHTQPDDFQPFLDQVLDGLRTELKLNILRDEAGWIEACQFAYTNHFDAERVLETFRLMRKQTWRSGPIKPQTLADNLANFDKIKAEVSSVNGKSDPGKYDPSVPEVIVDGPCQRCGDPLCLGGGKCEERQQAA